MFGVGLNGNVLLFCLLCSQVAGLQIPLQSHAKSGIESESKSEGRPRKLHGRFLQVTDFHPDRFYEVYSSTSQDAACHRGSGPAGYYGAETSECDTPLSLVNATFDWIKTELKDSIDFVIWTGDSARHDNDEQNPRSIAQVVGLNEFMVQKFVDVFGKTDGDDDDDDPSNDLSVPVIPTFGNNDILPHNIFDKGPNRWTKTYLGIWQKFIPEAQRHQFDQGGWFNVEVIPNKLVVFSLNSLYFFDSNSAVDGCAAKSEPGYRQLEWMRIQLQYMRDRGMKAIIIGHVPPARTENKHSWDETCWQKYTLWMRQYRDVVVGSMYGHMNTDHFMLQDFQDIDKDVSDGYEMTHSTQNSRNIVEEPINAKGSANYLIELRDAWSNLPQPPSKRSMIEFEALQGDALARLEPNGAPSIGKSSDLDAEGKRKGKKKKGKGKGDKKKKKKKPQSYLEEIGGLFGERYSVSFASPSVVPNYFPTIRVYEYNITGVYAQTLHPEGWTDMQSFASQAPRSNLEDSNGDDVKMERSRRKPKKRRFNLPHPPSSAAPPGPAYSPQSLSLLGFTQYYANLTRINNDFHAELEEQRWKEGKHHGQKPHDKDHEPKPENFRYDVLYETRSDSVYNLTDLTMRNFLDLAQRIGRFKSDRRILDQSPSENKAVITEDVQPVQSSSGRKGGRKKKKGGKKKKKHGGGSKKNNEAWYTFVQRAFVGTMDEDEIRQEFN